MRTQSKITFTEAKMISVRWWMTLCNVQEKNGYITNKIKIITVITIITTKTTTITIKR